MVKRKITAADVARAAGVSAATVDRVLNGRGGVGTDKERRVVDCALRLGLDRNIRLRPTRSIRVAAFVGPRTDPFFESVRVAFARVNRLFLASNIQVGVHHLDLNAPLEAVRRLREAAEPADAIVAIAPRHPSFRDALAAQSTNKPLVTMVSDLPGTGRLAYVGADNLAAGRVAGDLMARFIGGTGGQVAIVSNLQNFLALEEREAGFRAVLEERHPSCRLIGVVETSGDRERAGEFVRSAARSHPGLAGIYAVSTGSAAIAEALRALGLESAVTLITHELIPHRRDLLRRGVIDAIIDQDPDAQALAAIEILAHHFGRLEAPPSRLVTPFKLFLRENC